MLRKKPKRLKPRGESTEAEHWGGPTRRSNEGSVMELEQRGRVRRSHLAKQLETRMNSMHVTNKPFNIDKRLVYLCQEDTQASCCTKDEGRPFGTTL